MTDMETAKPLDIDQFFIKRGEKGRINHAGVVQWLLRRGLPGRFAWRMHDGLAVWGYWHVGDARWKLDTPKPATELGTRITQWVWELHGQGLMTHREARQLTSPGCKGKLIQMLAQCPELRADNIRKYRP